MSSRMVSRGGKTRFFGFFCLLLVLSSVLYVFHENQVELDGVRHSASSCTHQLESLSSQLQVIVEHKLKLERSLEDEKHEHLKTKEELNALIQDEKQLRDKQNVDSMNRYNEIEQNHVILQEEEKKLRDELEKLKLDYSEKVKQNKQLSLELDGAMSQVQQLKNLKSKLNNGKNIEKEQKPNESSDVRFIKSIDSINITKLKSSSVTPAINPQAIDGTTAKCSTPIVSWKVASTNESLQIKNNEANPINQPNIEINSAIESKIVSNNETIVTQESRASKNEPMKAMPAPPQEENVKKDKLNNIEGDKLPKQKNKSYEYEQEQEHFKEEDEDDEDFDGRDENLQPNLHYP